MSQLFKIKKVTAQNKDTFHRAGRIQLRKLAKLMGLSEKQYEVRSCMGGPAVAGEVILHTDKFYLQIFESSLGNDGVRIIYRDCKGRTDYSGGTNRYEKINNLLTSDFVSKLVKLQAINS